jgi:glycosyltransferase involved in cell wall biosynthesis
MDCTVIVATFGDPQWKRTAEQAVASAAPQGVPVVSTHLSGGVNDPGMARNIAVDIADDAGHAQGWLCFLDADDELEPGYIDAMAAAVDRWTADRPDTRPPLFAPAIRFGPDAQPEVLSSRNIRVMNPCVIGTLIHRTVFDDIGRFWSERAWEDWSLFRRANLTRSPIVWVRDAVYLVHESGEGRNSTIEDPVALHTEIIESHVAWMERR